MITPKSTAGILLREHDNVEQALRYAERKAQSLGAMNNAMALDYAEAAKQLRAELARQQTPTMAPTTVDVGGIDDNNGAGAAEVEQRDPVFLTPNM